MTSAQASILASLMVVLAAVVLLVECASAERVMPTRLSDYDETDYPAPFADLAVGPHCERLILQELDEWMWVRGDRNVVALYDADGTLVAASFVAAFPIEIASWRDGQVVGRYAPSSSLAPDTQVDLDTIQLTLAHTAGGSCCGATRRCSVASVAASERRGGRPHLMKEAAGRVSRLD